MFISIHEFVVQDDGPDLLHELALQVSQHGCGGWLVICKNIGFDYVIGKLLQIRHLALNIFGKKKN